ncbi:Uncharacterised protein [Salmonella enterica subsp. enterica serovar Typhi]|nr:hypothetical protein SM205186_07218 [Salmonella enterica subsp. enterica serovar Typhi]CFZ31230.1 Uncharacterised protein [Salmonella enterica subsp. enterica serovar Typhi]CGS23597.1 Uncharacterised protein [Salmonella enterica subsp. enterica serovar Typhi]CGW83943.1 Uncharacterised protein [Salmonella enterica subsp. enterica serovar Typhi]CGX35429.1 Uncharacterised protein [Salmonella enterica subsp. enterica serovar Typhi]
MAATINGVISLVGNTQTMRLVDFDVVRNHVRNVFNVSVVDRFVISGIECHWLYFQFARHFHRPDVNLVVEWGRVRINHAVEVIASSSCHQRPDNLCEVPALEYTANVRRQQDDVAFGICGRQLVKRQTRDKVELLALVG